MIITVDNNDDMHCEWSIVSSGSGAYQQAWLQLFLFQSLSRKKKWHKVPIIAY